MNKEFIIHKICTTKDRFTLIEALLHKENKMIIIGGVFPIVANYFVYNAIIELDGTRFKLLTVTKLTSIHEKSITLPMFASIVRPHQKLERYFKKGQASLSSLPSDTKTIIRSSPYFQVNKWNQVSNILTSLAKSKGNPFSKGRHSEKMVICFESSIILYDIFKENIFEIFGGTLRASVCTYSPNLTISEVLQIIRIFLCEQNEEYLTTNENVQFFLKEHQDDVKNLFYNSIKMEKMLKGRGDVMFYYESKFDSMFPPLLLEKGINMGYYVKHQIRGCENTFYYQQKRQDNASRTITLSMERIWNNFQKRSNPTKHEYSTTQLSNEQLSVIENINSYPFLVITGGPGTGKTRLIKTIFELLGGKQKVLLLSHVGCAVDHLRTLGMDASTIHHRFYSGENNTSYEYVIVDEFSVIDNETAAILYSLCQNAKTIFHFGDLNQISPIDCGNLASDLINFSTQPPGDQIVGCFRLETNFRSTQDIVLNCKRYLSGKKMIWNDTTFIKMNEGLETILSTNIQFLALTNRTRIKINDLFDDKISVGKTVVDNFYQGKRIMINEKNFSKRVTLGETKQVCNGSIYTIVGMNRWNVKEKKIVNINDSGILVLSLERKCENVVDKVDIFVGKGYIPHTSISSAWCITVDKAQGKEFDKVCLVLFEKDSHGFNHHHGYVAISRSKTHFYCYGCVDELETLAFKRSPLRKSDLIYRWSDPSLSWNESSKRKHVDDYQTIKRQKC